MWTSASAPLAGGCDAGQERLAAARGDGALPHQLSGALAPALRRWRPARSDVSVRRQRSAISAGASSRSGEVGREPLRWRAGAIAGAQFMSMLLVLSSSVRAAFLGPSASAVPAASPALSRGPRPDEGPRGGAAAAEARGGGGVKSTKSKRKVSTKAATAKIDNFKYAGNVKPAEQSPTRAVPKAIMRPDYAADGRPKATGPMLPWQIEVKSAKDIEGSARRARRARGARRGGRDGGAGRQDRRDRRARPRGDRRSAYPSPLNYHGFPKSCCTSVDEVICHGIPDARELRAGEIVNIDVTCYYQGYHGDCSETFMVGEVDEAGKQLVKVTHDCWRAAIEYCKPGQPYKGSARSSRTTSSRTATRASATSAATASARCSTRRRMCSTTRTRSRGGWRWATASRSSR